MAFGIKRQELIEWKKRVKRGEIAILTHYWQDDRFPDCTTVTKVGCSDVNKLIKWGQKYNLHSKFVHYNAFPHFDLFGKKQKEILLLEQKHHQIKRFKL